MEIQIFSKLTIFVALVIMWGPIFLLDTFEDRNWFKTLKLMSYMMLGAALFNIVAGIQMMDGWSDLLVNEDGVHISDQSTTRRRGGIVLLAIQFWPYILTLMAILSAAVAIKSIQRLKPHA